LSNKEGMQMCKIVTIGARGIGRATRRVEILNKSGPRLAERRRRRSNIAHRIIRHSTPPIELYPSTSLSRKRLSAVSVYIIAETIFGITIVNSTGRHVPVRLIGEQHVFEDLGRIPSFADWVRCIRPEPWMGRAGHLDAGEVSDA
jgi:hypothetical protein